MLESEGIMEVMGSPGMLLPYTVAFFASLVALYYSLKWLMNIMRQGNLMIFAVYCFIVGPLVLIFS